VDNEDAGIWIGIAWSILFSAGLWLIGGLILWWIWEVM
jgi:hypothetical protein